MTAKIAKACAVLLNYAILVNNCAASSMYFRLGYPRLSVASLARSKAEAEFRKMKHFLHVEHDLLVESIELMLQDHIDGLELSKLLSDIDMISWKDHGVDRIMRQMLGPLYARYVGALQEVRLKVEELRSALQLDQHGKV